jgi:hypothetical protein
LELGRFRLLDLKGAGATGVVFRGERTGTDLGSRGGRRSSLALYAWALYDFTVP